MGAWWGVPLGRGVPVDGVRPWAGRALGPGRAVGLGISGVSCRRKLIGRSPRTGTATAIQVHPIASSGPGAFAGRVSAARGPSAMGDISQSGDAPPSDATIRRHAGPGSLVSFMATGSSPPARSVTVRTQDTPTAASCTPAVEGRGCAVKPTSQPCARGVRVHLDSRRPPGSTRRSSAAASKPAPARHRTVRRPGRQPEPSSAVRFSGSSGASRPSVSSSATENTVRVRIAADGQDPRSPACAASEGRAAPTRRHPAHPGTICRDGQGRRCGLGRLEASNGYAGVGLVSCPRRRYR